MWSTPLLMVPYSHCPSQCYVSPKTGFPLTSATSLLSPSSPCGHISPLPLPGAPVYAEGHNTFSCICHGLYVFLMTLLDHLHSPFTCSP